ncbi:MAG: alpha/beta fold hydrolase [Planctomycetaceae bacterium]|nr:alpha/beta fold hydrolase [Planctomycetaceae bacterium]
MTSHLGYSFASHYLTLPDGLRCHYVNEPNANVPGVDVPENQSPLLMVHGNPTWSYLWRNLITHFADRFRCVALDHIGCGLSDKPDEDEYPFTLQRRIDDLVHLIEHLDLKNITLIAHDWGGAVGMGAATRLPERFKQFVFLNTAAFRSPNCPLRIRLCRLPIFGRLAIQGLNLFARGTLAMASANRKNLTPEVRRAYLAPYNSWNNRLAVYRFVQDIPLSPKHPSYETLLKIEESLPRFREHRVCLIWGMLDWCFSPEFLKQFLQFFPEAEVYRVERAHHLVLEDAPDEVIAALESFFKMPTR